jgi:CRP/FNR family transcriptional regulator
MLTAGAILNRQTFPALATVEQDAEAVFIPAETLRDWVRRYDLWCEFVFDLLSQRLASVLAIVDEVAFRRMDARVAELLLGRRQRAHPIRVTHQAIAAELGSSREVISRVLGELAGRGLIRLGRGTIEILDAESLERLAAV